MRALKIAYASAILLLVALALSSHFILKKQMSDSAESVFLIQTSERLRASALKSALIARNLVTTVNMTERENLRNELLTETRRMQEAKGVLLHGGNAEQPARQSSREVRRIFFEEPVRLSDRIEAFIAAAESLANTREVALRNDHPDMKYIRREATGNAFLSHLDSLTVRYEVESEDRMHRLQYFEGLLIFVEIMTLVMTALFIFKPLADRVQAEIEGLSTLNDKLTQRVAERTAVIEQSAEKLKESERIAILDPLTELLNRRGLQQALSRETKMRSRADDSELIVLIADLDDFKVVNDQHSHAMGDEVLKKIGQILRSSLRSKDYVCRIGGDEFIILLPRTSPADALAIAETLRMAISNARHMTPDLQPIRVSASLGLISVTDPDTSVNELLRLTHSVLYRSKQAGKNRVSADVKNAPRLTA